MRLIFLTLFVCTMICVANSNVVPAHKEINPPLVPNPTPDCPPLEPTKDRSKDIEVKPPPKQKEVKPPPKQKEIKPPLKKKEVEHLPKKKEVEHLPIFLNRVAQTELFQTND
ncbi:uncharacterized protein LOC105850242 isoform X6 [Hydra vulgaris]|uniref:uncharacterized protein LOC105850242 isoform X6 n=1 Tax=Hydra vulgaris TaxID=6087 RepID=UPI0032E9EA76